MPLHRLRGHGESNSRSRRAEDTGSLQMTLARMLFSSSQRQPDATAIVDGKKRLNYGDWQTEIRRLAGGLHELGLMPGDHLVSVLSNRLETARDQKSTRLNSSHW